jgi:hypothetical protein
VTASLPIELLKELVTPDQAPGTSPLPQ